MHLQIYSGAKLGVRYANLRRRHLAGILAWGLLAPGISFVAPPSRTREQDNGSHSYVLHDGMEGSERYGRCNLVFRSPNSCLTPSTFVALIGRRTAWRRQMEELRALALEGRRVGGLVARKMTIHDAVIRGPGTATVSSRPGDGPSRIGAPTPPKVRMPTPVEFGN